MANAILQSDEWQRLRDEYTSNWAFLPTNAIDDLHQRFVKTVAKKVEHTKRKVRQKASLAILELARTEKTEVPFVQDVLAQLRCRTKSRSAGWTGRSRSFMDSGGLLSANTTASSCESFLGDDTAFNISGGLGRDTHAIILRDD